MFRLPTTVTVPFCPPEMRSTAAVLSDLPLWKELLHFAGSGPLMSVGYMGPGNWVANIEAGSCYGYALLSVVVLSSLATMMLQRLSVRFDIVTGMDLAHASRNRYQPDVLRVQRLLAELSITACNLVGVLGCALAFYLLLDVPILQGVMLTALDTLIMLGLKGKNSRQLGAIVPGLILTIGLYYFAEFVFIKLHWPSVAAGLTLSWRTVNRREPLYLATGILDATVIPHNLYLYPSIVRTHMTANTEAAKREVIDLSRFDTIVSLGLALLVNGATLILAATTFSVHGRQNMTDTQDVYHLLEPTIGTTLTGLLFGIALLTTGQSSTFTGAATGQVLMKGFLGLRIPCWRQRLIARALALIPAFISVAMLDDHATGKLLVINQAVLGLQLPFATFPLIRMIGGRTLMGVFASSRFMSWLVWNLFVVTSVANVWSIWQVPTG